MTAEKTQPQAGTAGLPHSWQFRPSNWSPIHHCLPSYESPQSELQAWQFPESHGRPSAGPFVLWPSQEMGLILTFVPKQESRLGGGKLQISIDRALMEGGGSVVFALSCY